MKNFTMPAAFILLACLCLAGCDRYNLTPHDFRGHSHGDSIPAGDRDKPDSSRPATTDVTYLSGITVPENYDWRKDSLQGRFEGRLVLIREGETILTLDCSPSTQISADPDRHHLIDGDLFTQFNTPSGTVVKKNGKTVAVFDGKEYIRGILPLGDDVYVLGQNIDGEGFALHRGNTPLFVKQSGNIYGGFSDMDYDGHGALISDAGQICFMFTEASDTFAIRDGVQSPRTQDWLRDFHLVTLYRNGKCSFPQDRNPNSVKYEKGLLKHYGRTVDGDCWFFPPQSVAFKGEDICMAVTPRDRSRSPYVWTLEGKKESRKKIGGADILTGINVRRETTSAPPSNRPQEQ